MADQNNKNNQSAPQEENLSQLLKIRRDKLKELQEGGNDPFQITRFVVDNDSANIKGNFDALEGRQVAIAGPPHVQAGDGQGVLLRPAGQVRPHPALRQEGRDG